MHAAILPALRNVLEDAALKPARIVHLPGQGQGQLGEVCGGPQPEKDVREAKAHHQQAQSKQIGQFVR